MTRHHAGRPAEHDARARQGAPYSSPFTKAAQRPEEQATGAAMDPKSG